MPPATFAGNSLKYRKPAASALISSDAVATAGRYGMRKFAPAASNSARRSRRNGERRAGVGGEIQIVRRHHGARSHADLRHLRSRWLRWPRSACGVRNVTSMTRMPPRTSARARSGCGAASSMVTTGITGESCRISAIDALVFMRSSSHREAPTGQQLVDLRHAGAIEIARNRVLQHRRGEREVERGLLVQPGDAAVQDARCEGVARADAVHDGLERIRARRREAFSGHLLCRQLMMIHAVLDTHHGGEALQTGERVERAVGGMLESIRRRQIRQRQAQHQGDGALVGKQQVRLIGKSAQDARRHPRARFPTAWPGSCSRMRPRGRVHAPCAPPAGPSPRSGRRVPA